MITWVRLNQPEYQWQVPNFQRPNQDELVVYELLLEILMLLIHSMLLSTS